MPLSAARRGLQAVLLAYLVIGGLYALHTPAWQAPDEPAHYNYIAHIALERSLPVLQPGDYDQAYLDRLKAERFPAYLPIDSVRYEFWQPPLYYLLAAPLFAATGGSLLALRLFSLALGSWVIVLTWLLGRLLFPGLPALALAAAGFVAFIPQHLAMMASVNNDALAELLLALGLYLTLGLLLSAPSERAPLWRLGLVLGLAFLTKLSTYPLAAVMGAALLLLARRERWPLARFLSAAAQLFLPALLLGGAWWLRNLAVYGGFDFLGMLRHDAVVQGQLRTAEALAQWGSAGYAARFVQTTFRSFWGQFGWMGVVMDGRVYLALLAYSLLLAAGLAGAAAARLRRGPPFSLARVDALALLLVVALLAVAVYLYYNLSFVQFQGRYLYPALPVLALAAAISLRQWSQWLLAAVRPRSDVRRRQALALLPLAPVVCMAALAVLALYLFVVPQLAG